ncbi:MAG: hypothetical protein J6B67_03995, partial [Oscillospiraceae bacterium]|nr:hypothetical protein [Oscillospiraceae bacterium]
MKDQRKKNIKTIPIKLRAIILIAVAVGILLLGGCKQEDGQKQDISFREKSVTVEKYETHTLELLGAEGKEIEWKSNDEEIATVDNGVVCGWKKGNTQIVASVDGIEVSCNVIVLDNQYVPVVTLGERDGLTMDIGGTYTLKPVLYYNGRSYADVEYTFSSSSDAVTVDEAGVITAVAEGTALVSVQGLWRGNAVEADMSIEVIDAATSIEVSGKVFDIYFNGRGADYPSKVDIGISIFENDEPVSDQDASVQYTELIMEGDVAGAAYIKNGIAYAAKLGTTHFIAEYTTAEGDVVRSASFAVNVHQTPADKYMAPIAGEEFTFFVEPMNPTNSVEWDEELGAFHLTNKNDAEDDGRAFLFSRDYMEKIIRYTNAKSIVFEVKRDGISNGCPAPDQVIFQGFYPNWYDAAEYTRIDNTGEWTKIEVFFDKIPLDSDGNRKAIMLLSTKEGMYIRNIRPMTEGSFLTMDLEFTTSGGNWSDDIEIGLFPHSFEGDINSCTKRTTIKAGVKTTVKFRLDDFLENGSVPGFGLVVYGGPAWDAKLPDGFTPDRHTLKISNLRVSGEQNYSLDLGTAAWKTGKDGTGFANANGSGTPYYEDGAIIITNGFRFDGHKFTLNSAEAKERTYINMDLLLTTLGEFTGPVEIRFYPHNFEGSAHEKFADKVVVTAGEKTAIKLNLANYLVDGEFPGIGVAIFGGPAWDAKLADGVTPDRHDVIISNVHLTGEKEQTIDLSYAMVNTGFSDTNSGGTAAIVDGAVVIAGGFCYDGHMISFTGGAGPEKEPSTYINMDLLLTTLSESTGPVEIRFYAHNFEGSAHEQYTDKVVVTAGEKTAIKLNYDKYLVDGEFPGIGVAIFGGPTWDAKLADGVTPDRHNITISNVHLTGEKEQTIDLSYAMVSTGFSDTNSGGTAAIVDGAVVIAGGFCYDGHMITFGEETVPGETEPGTYLCMDLLLTTLSDSTDPVNIRLYNNSYTASVG